MSLIHYIPILTTVVSAIFFVIIFKHYLAKKKKYLLWWALGVLLYGLGTLTESLVTLTGWSPVLFRLWYVFGAIYGGVLLAQGSGYLLLKDKTMKFLTPAMLFVTLSASLLIFISPLDVSAQETDHRLTGSVLEWTFIRGITPIVNLYAFILLAGGAVYSALKYFKKNSSSGRVWGNVLIAVGALLPGIGGSFTKFGHVEVLYVTELLGIILIFWGYDIIRKDAGRSIHKNQ